MQGAASYVFYLVLHIYFIEETSVWILEAADWATGVEDGGVVDQASVPLPGSRSWLFRWVGAVDSCR